MGRLKAGLRFILTQIVKSFNSTMVRLKVLLPCLREPAICLFQFHNGSIKSARIIKDQVRRVSFNSTMVRLKAIYSGEVKTYMEGFNSTMVRLKEFHLLKLIAYYEGFNSTMVRLKVINVERVGKSIKGFNSTMVRLKVLLPCLREPAICLFQFHNGSIKSYIEDSIPADAITFQFHNGSIKRTFYDAINGNIPLFQFHNGSIKSVEF